MPNVVIQQYRPSAQQILSAVQGIVERPQATLIVKERPPEGSEVFGGVPYEGRRLKDYDRGLAYLADVAGRRPFVNQVFLGGACDPTTWRQDLAIPILKGDGCAFFNPQVREWDESCIAKEAQAKAESFILLFVFDEQTRGLATIVEVVENVEAGRRVVISRGFLRPGLVIAGQEVNMEEAMDINMARSELFGWAAARGAWVLPTVEDAVDECVRQMEAAAEDNVVSDIYE